MNDPVINFVVYDEQGTILRSGSGPRSMLPIQAEEGESVLEGSGNDTEHMVDTETLEIVPKQV